MSKPSTKKKVAEHLEVTIESLDEEGIGLATWQGKRVLVPGTLPGERVEVAVDHEGQRQMGGRVLRRMTSAPERSRRWACPHAQDCLGCGLISMDYAAQLRFKQEKVARALDAQGTQTGARVLPILEAPNPLGYRCSAKLAIGKERGKVRIGLYRRHSHELVDIGDCPLHHPLINQIASVVREEIERQGVWVYNPARGSGLLRYLAVRVSPTRNEAMVTFITAERNYREITHLAKWLVKKVPQVVSVQQNVNASAGNVIFGNQTLKMLGHPALLDQVGELRLRISPTSFFQVNHAQAERIYALVRRWAACRPEDLALDLYCGIGGIALNLARDAATVLGIEVVEEAVRNAADNARLNNLGNCRFRAGDAAELLEDLELEIAPGAVAVVNPPRKGCEAEVLKRLAALAPRVLLYVSCNPTSLARDLEMLATLGYQTEEIQPVDMFPQTPHVECVARLVPKKTP
ncbi:23S rRNA (uracil(1939)-C(5))-methyltransferase RlmD [Geoalkalibacter halelectricus]|uniref:23S rRNA (Uracil(1939)-C(5))-methyltransferase RlmD n=1 Tax=Geoalkalibacter halelectricus TaxID=2847045 RepID=A0ABY5ZNN1_9BACT|nr:23S rRNA (uracil(1939)-C(5))-methyltransferase RlmD [Geoalkalibacter halelectricus]MDO3377056.1 23S rRNA (uracil(1939)-C(5))-methyltransferase RlmD [Geoalkalibacter halelectricus]UWZ79490.1 23S rRNA (uracil(1939)-C(5))-methyltransferase RlmD [Geoalkalibacter halelectricus]